MKIGLIGLGIMGKPMAKNILKGGFTDLLVSDLNQAAVDDVVSCGAKQATNKEIGGEPKAIDGTLSFMVGGKQEIFDKFKPLLETMRASIVRCGEVGAGNTTKLANQIVVACNIQAVAEAFTMAQKAGVDPSLSLRRSEAAWQAPQLWTQRAR